MSEYTDIPSTAAADISVESVNSLDQIECTIDSNLIVIAPIETLPPNTAFAEHGNVPTTAETAKSAVLPGIACSYRVCPLELAPSKKRGNMALNHAEYSPKEELTKIASRQPEYLVQGVDYFFTPMEVEHSEGDRRAHAAANPECKLCKRKKLSARKNVQDLIKEMDPTSCGLPCQTAPVPLSSSS